MNDNSNDNNSNDNNSNDNNSNDNNSNDGDNRPRIRRVARAVVPTIWVVKGA